MFGNCLCHGTLQTTFYAGLFLFHFYYSFFLTISVVMLGN